MNAFRLINLTHGRAAHSILSKTTDAVLRPRLERRRRILAAAYSNSANGSDSESPRFHDQHSEEPKRVRLSKRMSELNLCSRRQADRLIQDSKVLLRGTPVEPVLGQKVDADESGIQIITKHGNIGTGTGTGKGTGTGGTTNLTIQKLSELNKGETILLHKPKNFVSGQPDPRHGHTPAVRLLTRDNMFCTSPELKAILSDGNYLHFHKRFSHQDRVGGGTRTSTGGMGNGNGIGNGNNEHTHQGKYMDVPATLMNYAPAGRLDLDSSGLLLFTQNGIVAKHLLRENTNTNTNNNSHVPVHKEYLVKVEPVVSLSREEVRMGMKRHHFPLVPVWDLSILLQGGRRLWDDRKALKPLIEVEWVEEGSTNTNTRLTLNDGHQRDRRGDSRRPLQRGTRSSIKTNESSSRSRWDGTGVIRMVLQEGKKRQIRRMCREILGLHVVELKRIRIGDIKLDDLPVGKWRPLTDEERLSLVPID